MWRNRPIEGEHAYVYLDGIWLKRSWGGEVKNVAVLVAIGVREDGYREILGVVEGHEGRHRELAELPEAFERAWPEGRASARLRQVPGPAGSRGRVLSRSQLAALHGPLVSQRDERRAQEPGEGSDGHAQSDPRPGGPPGSTRQSQPVAEKLDTMRLSQAATIVRDGVDETLSYMAFPREHWTRIRTNNVLERIMREIRRRTRVVGNFPDGKSAVMLVAARLRHIAGTRWGSASTSTWNGSAK